MGNKTVATSSSVTDFLASIAPERRRLDGFALLDLFQEVTGYEPVMWGDAMVGFGRYHYRYASGREGDFLATGFSPRKSALSIYIMPGYQDYGDILTKLGRHKRGKSCLYINKLADVDVDILGALIKTGLQDLHKRWPVTPT